MVSAREFHERWGWWWVRWVMVVFHVILTISSFALLIFLSRIESVMPQHYTPDFGVIILLALLATLYGILGMTTFWLSRRKLGRVLAVMSVLIIALYYFFLLALQHRSAFCGINRINNETLVLDFDETRIANCDFGATACLLTFPRSVLVQCPTLPSFWDHVLAMHDPTVEGSAVINNLVDGGLLYNIFFLIVLFLSLVLSMLLGVKEAVIVRPDPHRAPVPLHSIL
ncbi:hypothetical protein E2C01_099205 [Portunus trituberculatus]|uniref:Uncharacterized protein n=1 Tax=Portunus trituberculatus TaxID=210409 RepID=A0A5B7KA84_PORTR|nr:hypothetical protein [Portunus trituberculatus]